MIFIIAETVNMEVVLRSALIYLAVNDSANFMRNVINPSCAGLPTILIFLRGQNKLKRRGQVYFQIKSEI